VFSGIGLAIPVEMIEHVVSQLIDTGEVQRGFIGVILVDETRETGSARDNGFRGEGVEIRTVNPGEPADRAGLRQGDVVLSVDGTGVDSIRQIQSIISSHVPGETLDLRVWRFNAASGEGETLTAAVTLDELLPEKLLSRVMQGYLSAFGLLNNLATATEQRAARLEVPFRRGVLVERVVEGSPIDGVIRPGTIITAVFDAPVQNLDEFYAALERAVSVSPGRVALRIVTPDGREDTIYLQP